MELRYSKPMEIPADTPAFLGADQADNRVRIFNPFSPEDRKPTLWSYPAEDEAPIKFMPTDAKRVEIAGVVHILAAYHGRVRLVRLRDRKLIKDFPSYSSCHSAEVLPDGAIVTANSNHGKLRLHQDAKQFTDLELPYAHGVTWDKTRERLWALGDLLYRLRYEDGKLAVDQKHKMPMTPTGHDLFPLRDEAKLLVSNNDALFLFDIAKGSFETISKLEEIKSASQHLDGTIWATDPSNMKGAASWQTDSVMRVRPAEPKLAHRNRGSKFYKARWWQKVPFSY